MALNCVSMFETETVTNSLFSEANLANYYMYLEDCQFFELKTKNDEKNFYAFGSSHRWYFDDRLL